MYKIENHLLFKENTSVKTFIDVAEQFLKESSLLVDNLSKTYLTESENKLVFPLKNELYDASWYKNLVIAAHIIEDRIYSHDDSNVDYFELLKNINFISFNSFAKRWNLIYLTVSAIADQFQWNIICEKYDIKNCARKMQTLINAHIPFNMNELNRVSLNLNEYDVTYTPKSQSADLIQELKNIATVDIEADAEQAIINQINPVHLASANESEDEVNPNVEVRIANELSSAHIKRLDLIMGWLKGNKNEIKTYKVNHGIGSQNLEAKGINRLKNDVAQEISTNKATIKELSSKLPENQVKKHPENENLNSNVSVQAPTPTPVVAPVETIIDTKASTEPQVAVSAAAPKKSWTSIFSSKESKANITPTPVSTPVIEEVKPVIEAQPIVPEVKEPVQQTVHVTPTPIVTETINNVVNKPVSEVAHVTPVQVIDLNLHADVHPTVAEPAVSHSNPVTPVVNVEPVKTAAPTETIQETKVVHSEPAPQQTFQQIVEQVVDKIPVNNDDANANVTFKTGPTTFSPEELVNHSKPVDTNQPATSQINNLEKMTSNTAAVDPDEEWVNKFAAGEISVDKSEPVVPSTAEAPKPIDTTVAKSTSMVVPKQTYVNNNVAQSTDVKPVEIKPIDVKPAKKSWKDIFSKKTPKVTAHVEPVVTPTEIKTQDVRVDPIVPSHIKTNTYTAENVWNSEFTSNEVKTDITNATPEVKTENTVVANPLKVISTPAIKPTTGDVKTEISSIQNEIAKTKDFIQEYETALATLKANKPEHTEIAYLNQLINWIEKKEAKEKATK